MKRAWFPPPSQAQASEETSQSVTAQCDKRGYSGNMQKKHPAQPEEGRKGQELVHLMPELGLDGQIIVCLNELGRKTFQGREICLYKALGT